MEKYGSKEMIIFAQSVTGASHTMKGIVCQDSSGSRMPREDVHIAVVADGHGDPTCFRSDRGSGMAVSAALECLEKFAEHYEDMKAIQEEMDPVYGDEYIRRQLTDAIVSGWSAMVRTDIAANRLTEDELDRSGDFKDIYLKGRHVERIYGSTLVAALKAKDYMVLIQQGDGRCDIMRMDGSVDQPVPKDDRCHGNVTTSMSDEIAADEIRSIILPLEEDVTGCCLSTDGVENSFYEDEKILEFLVETGLKLTAETSENHSRVLVPALEEVTEKGNGDDVSLAGWFDPDKLNESAGSISDRLKARRREDEIAQLEKKLAVMEQKDRQLREQVRSASPEQMPGYMKEYMDYRKKFNRLRAAVEELKSE